MKTLLPILVLMSLFNTPLSWSQHEHHNHKALKQPSQAQNLENADCNNVIDVKVNGLVCDFCARALEKVFNKHSAVEAINVDLSKGKVAISLHPQHTLDDAILSQLMADSGYTVVAIKRGC